MRTAEQRHPATLDSCLLAPAPPGMSRSPTVTAFALSRVQNSSPTAALAKVGGSVSPAMWQSAVDAMRE